MPIRGLVQRRDKTDPEAPAAQVYLEVLEHQPFPAKAYAIENK
jgi:hypothetical protein